MNKLTFYLREIKYRLFYLFLGFFFTFFAAFICLPEIIDQLIMILGSKHFVLSTPADYWIAIMFLSSYLGFVSIIPIFFYNYWNFMAPSLYPSEQLRLKTFILVQIALTLVVQIINYSQFYPTLISHFFVIQEIESLQMECMPSFLEYILFIIHISLGSLITSQMPVIAYLAVQCNMLNLDFLLKYRKHFYAFFVLLSAFFSPPDIWVQLLMASYLIVFYEITFFLSIMIFIPMARSCNSS